MDNEIEKMQEHRAGVMRAEASRLAGEPTYTLDEVHSMLEEKYMACDGVRRDAGSELSAVRDELLERQAKMKHLSEELRAIEEDRLHGKEGYSVHEVSAMMRKAIEEA